MSEPKPAGGPIRLLLIDDHPVMRLGLRTLFDAAPDMTVIGEADTVDTALERQRDFKAEVAIVPWRLEGEPRGVELCRELKSLPDPPRVLFYTSFNSAEEAAASFLSGADAYVHKTEPTSHLMDAIRQACTGRRVWLLGRETGQAERLREMIGTSGLTQREHSVLGLMLQRHTNAEIARELFIELPTVKSHVRNILAKLGLRSRSDLF